MSKSILVIGAEQVKKALEKKEKEIMDIVAKTYISHNESLTSLPHSIFLRFPNDNTNRIIGLPAYIGGDCNKAGMKWISSFPHNIENGIERASAVIILNNMQNGMCESVIEGSIISATRTAASAALAALTIHGNKEETTVGIVGCGRINKEIIHFLKVAFPNLKKAVLFDKSEERAKSFSELISSDHITSEIVETIEAVFEKTKLVSFATTASTPYIDELKNCDEETTILNISLRDFGPTVIEKCDNIVDDIDHVLREKTSVHLTEQKLQNRDFIRCNLADILSGKQPSRVKNKMAVFSPFGLGVLDLALANYVKEFADNNNIGEVINNFLP
nr:2,3-diaminopropionate biosynthesis protein SbnB [uncultured Lachnoclostridium sp.]